MRLLLAILTLTVLAVAARAEFTLADGDRVVWLGSTLVEQEQRSGWWELALTARFPGKKLTFRNLAWSGDTVFGDAHTGYAYTRTGSPNVEVGFKHLIEHTLALKPTVLMLGYGTNESFEGEKGLEKFTKGMNRLLDSLAPTKAKVVLLSPMQQGNVGKPFPDPAKNNKNLRLYADAIKAIAKQRNATFVDLIDLLGDPAKQKGATENGVHLTAHGYQWSSLALLKGLGLEVPGWRVEADRKAQTATAQGTKVEWTKERKLQLTDDYLPLSERVIVMKNLDRLPSFILIDDDFKPRDGPCAVGGPEEFAKGVELVRGIPFTQREKLRQAIVDKNELYFHRWRPQNETYLFGFRKHEQGKNAVEIPKFDPLVEKKENEIVELSKPAKWTLSLRGSDK